jgi:hypothetical protein
MSPGELARLHPRLHHLTDPDLEPSLRRLGLLPASTLVERFEVPLAQRDTLTHPVHGVARLHDNSPLSETALRACLDDDLTPEDWLVELNRRVFFWPTEADLAAHLAARFNRDRDKLVLSFDTLGLATAHAEQIEIAPINTGSTIRKPARRGRSTFAPLARHRYPDWQRLRGGRDRIREVTVVGGVPDVMAWLVETRVVRAGERLG